MLFSLKSYAKKCFTVWRNYFSTKSYSTFSAKMFQAPSFKNVCYIWYCIPYMEVTVGKEKKAKHGEMRCTVEDFFFA